jgi:hypothetical protein
LAQLLQRVKHLCRGVIDASCEKLLLPPECAPVLDLVQARARRIFQEASLKDVESETKRKFPEVNASFG